MSLGERRLYFEPLESRRLLHGGEVGWPEGEAGDPMPDFALRDVNPASSTSGQDVSPRQYLQQVSAWYFGHAT